MNGSNMEETAPKQIYSGYEGGEEMPLGGYAVLLGAYTAAFGAFLILAHENPPERIEGRDLFLTGIATHKLARILTRDWVTSPLRAPFTRYKEALDSGEVKETSRGRGLRRATGDLLTCPWCIGPWVAGAFAAGWKIAPRSTRVVVETFSAVTMSDFMHQVYDMVRQRARG